MAQTYGWKRDLPDHRDRLYLARPRELPPLISLRSLAAPVRNQGSLGSCTANAGAEADEMQRMKQDHTGSTPLNSRLYLYYNTRAIEGTVDHDAGATIRDTFKSLVKYGICDESEWPYEIGRFTEKPPEACYADSGADQVIEYLSVAQNLTTMKSCLVDGYPFMIGISVYESFESDQVARTGIVPMPGRNEKLLGGHAVLVIGYDDTQQRFLCQNSWGEGWGDKGFFTIPYAYLLSSKLSGDFWTIRRLQDGVPPVPPEPPKKRNWWQRLWDAIMRFFSSIF